MKSRIAHILYFSVFIILITACQNKADTINSFEESEETEESATEILFSEIAIRIPNGYSDLSQSKYNELQKNDTIVINFEKVQTSDAVKAYEEFLSGNRTACIADTIYDNDCGILTKWQGEDISLENLIQDLVETSNDLEDGIDSVQYALIDCGNDGKKQLALRTYGMSYHTLGDDSDFTMVFDWQGGEVSMIYAVASWARDCHTLYANGYVSGYGSGGRHYTWEGILGTDGSYQASYHCAVSGSGLHGMSPYWALWEKYGMEGVPTDFYEYTINDETIYAYDILKETTDEKMQMIQNYIQENEAVTGMHLVTSDEAWKCVEENRKMLGITDEMGNEENKIAWKTLPLEPSALKMIQN